MSKRRFFQLHLSTAVVLMLVAGVLVWANAKAERDSGYAEQWFYEFNNYGWPMVFCESCIRYDFTLGGTTTSYLNKMKPKEDTFSVARAFYNVLISLAILLAVWQLCEWRKRNRRFFQMHLSTAVVVMIVAGILLWANVRRQEDDFIVVEYGWPFIHKWTTLGGRTSGGTPIFHYSWGVKYGVYNALVALAILLAVWQLFEWRIRRREAK